MINDVEDNYVVTFCYPGCEKFFKKFINSINHQIFKKFKIIFICDKFKIKKKNLKKIKVIYDIFNFTGSIANIRYKTFKKLINIKAKKICFADLDDQMDKNRTKLIFKNLDRNKVVFNDLNINYIYKKKIKKNFLSNFFKNNQKINYKNIIESNFLGFTNTGLQLSALEKNIKNISTSKKILVYDWYFWSILLQNHNAKFISKTSTNYNIFSNSKNKIPAETDPLSILYTLKIKQNFYSLMSSFNKNYKKKYLIYKQMNTKFKNKKYIKLNKKKLILKPNFWWDISFKNENKSK